jgi:hypothetical protein
MVRRDVDALVRWLGLAGSGAATALPHAFSLPPALAVAMTCLGCVGIAITALTVIIAGLTKLTAETTRFVAALERFIAALDKLRTQIRRFRRRSKVPPTGKAAPHKAPPSPAR